VVVDGAFVPRHRTHAMRDIFQIERMQRGCLSAISLAIAEAAMVEFIAQSKGRIVAGQRASDFAWIKFGGDPMAVNL
jgi:hypothetical protein